MLAGVHEKTLGFDTSSIGITKTENLDPSEPITINSTEK